MNYQFKRSPYQLRLSRIKHTLYILTVLFTLSACSDEEAQQTVDEQYHQNADLITIASEPNYTIARNYLGQISAKQDTSLSFEYSGHISTVLVDNGDIVKKGQLLAYQNTQLLGYKTDELQAQVAKSQAQITLNKANLTRIKTLINDGYSSKQQLDELNAENQIIHAQINALNAQIHTIEYQRKKSSLIAPFDGVITKRFISEGEVIAAGNPSFRIIESANNEINVGIPSHIARTLTLGQVLQIKLNNRDEQAKLISIGQQIDAVNRTVKLRLKMLKKLDVPKNFNGQLVRITIEDTIEKSGFWLPISAITDGVRGQWQVFIATALAESKNNYKLQAATVNILHANEHSVYVNGLANKPYNIISQGVHRYVAGQVITATAPASYSSVGNR